MRKMLVIGIFLSILVCAGCEQSQEQSSAESTPVTRTSRESRPIPSRASQDDSLYRQLVETMQQENLDLKRQIQATMDRCEGLEGELSEIKKERDVAFRAYLKVSKSIQDLETDAGSKDQKIKELEQANEIQQETIVQLNQQLAQLMQVISNAGIGITGLANIIDPNFTTQTDAMPTE